MLDFGGQETHLPANDHGPSHAENLQHAGNRLAELGPRHAHELCAGASGIEERPEKIENGALTAFGAELARSREMLESRMVFWRKEKGEMVLTQRLSCFFRCQIDSHTEGFEHVGAAGLGGNGAIAMLRDVNASRSEDQSHGGRNVERIQAITAGAAHVDDFALACLPIDRGRDGPSAELTRER